MFDLEIHRCKNMKLLVPFYIKERHLYPFNCQDSGHCLLEDRVLHKEAWVAKLLGTHLSGSIKRSNFYDEITRHWQLKGYTNKYIYLFLCSFHRKLLVLLFNYFNFW